MKNDSGSLTAQEYEEIYHVLNDYCVSALKENTTTPSYMIDIKKAKAKRILKIVKKMHARMQQFPPDFV